MMSDGKIVTYPKLQMDMHEAGRKGVSPELEEEIEFIKGCLAQAILSPKIVSRKVEGERYQYELKQIL